MFNKSVIQWLSIFISIIGCGYQMVDIVITYVEYDLIYEITYRTPKSITLPDITYKIKYETALDQRKLLSNKSRVDLEFIKLLFKLTISQWSFDPYLNYTYAPDTFIRPQEYLDPISFNYTKSPYNLIVSAGQYNRLHYTVRSEKMFNYTYTKLLVMNQRALSTFELDNTYDRDGYVPCVNLHVSGTNPSGMMAHEYYITRNSINKYIRLTFRSLKTKLLEPPYKSLCKNYHDLGFKDKSHAINDCFLDNINDKIREKKTVNQLENYIDSLNLDGFKYDILFNCQRKYPNFDCSKEEYFPKLRLISPSNSSKIILIIRQLIKIY